MGRKAVGKVWCWKKFSMSKNYNQKFDINGVFTGIFTCRHVACEDAGRAAYSQLRLHITGECNQQQAGISCQNHRNVARRPVYMQRVLLELAHALAKVRNFERVVSKMQRVHATARALLVKTSACSE